MKLHEFLESKYVSTNLELHQNFSPYMQSKTRSIQKLIDLQRQVLMWFAYIALIKEYLEIKIGIREEPLEAMEIAKNIPKQPLKEVITVKDDFQKDEVLSN